MRRAGLLLTLCIATAAHADWPAGGKYVFTPEDALNGVRLVRVFDLPSGDLCVLGVGLGGNSNGYSIQRISPLGDLAPGWPAAGKSFGQVSKTTFPLWQGFAPDDSGNVWHSYHEGSTAKAQIITAPGLYVPSTSPFYFPVTGSNPLSSAVAAPGGDMYVSSGRLHRLTRNGTEAPGWPAGGVVTGGDELISDGHGGVVLFNGVSFPPVVKRYDSNAAAHTGWPAGGLLLQASTPDAFFEYYSIRHLFDAGPDHFLAVWTEIPRTATEKRRVLVQGFSGDGAIDPAWPVDGVEAVAPDTLEAVTPVADGAGGIYIVWQAHGLPRATHIASNGSFIGGLDASGVSPLDPAAQYVPSHGDLNGPFTLDQMVADRRPGGGLLFAWNDTRTSPAVSFRLRWLTPALLPEPGVSDAVVLPASPHAKPGILVGLHSDGAEGAFLSWYDLDPSAPPLPDADLWMTRVPAPGLLGAPRSVASHGVQLSAPRPNPARGAIALELALADHAPARVEVLDVSGRVQASTVVQGAGAHAVRLGDDRALEPGLYFVRATGPSGTSCVRVALTR